jgi:hypothetical protein
LEVGNLPAIADGTLGRDIDQLPDGEPLFGRDFEADSLVPGPAVGRLVWARPAAEREPLGRHDVAAGRPKPRVLDSDDVDAEGIVERHLPPFIRESPEALDEDGVASAAELRGFAEE